jgi:hypothetical protein
MVGCKLPRGAFLPGMKAQGFILIAMFLDVDFIWYLM